MAVNRLFSVEFAKQGTTEAFVPGSGVSGSATTATSAYMDVNRQRAYIAYSGPVLRRLAAQNGQPVDERDLFKQVSDDMKKAEFQDFRLGLAVLAEQQFVEAAGRNEFGDLRYRITDAGLAVVPTTE